MSSIYSKITKINKQKVDKIESELFIIKSNIKKIKAEIEGIYSSISTLTIPEQGEYKEVNAFRERRRLLNAQKERLAYDLEANNLNLKNKQQEYKKAKLEYEKIKHLQEQEIAKKLIKIKKDEQKELDEVSNMLFKKRSEY